MKVKGLRDWGHGPSETQVERSLDHMSRRYLEEVRALEEERQAGLRRFLQHLIAVGSVLLLLSVIAMAAITRFPELLGLN